MKANGQVSNSAKAVKINCPFEQTNLSGGVSDHYWVQNLDVLTFTYLSRSRSHLQNIQVKTLTVSNFGIELEPKAVTKPGSYIIREQLNLLGFFFFYDLHRSSLENYYIVAASPTQDITNILFSVSFKHQDEANPFPP